MIQESCRYISTPFQIMYLLSLSLGFRFSDTKIADDASWLTSSPRMPSFSQQQRSDVHATDPATPLSPQSTQTHLGRVADLEKTIKVLSKQNESSTLAVSRLKGFETGELTIAKSCMNLRLSISFKSCATGECLAGG